MRRLLLLSSLALLATGCLLDPADAQGYPPGYYPPGPPPPPPPGYDRHPPRYAAGPAYSPENCGTPDEPKPCPPLPRVPLPYYPANRQ
jgi:hypothetical protein